MKLERTQRDVNKELIALLGEFQCAWSRLESQLNDVIGIVFNLPYSKGQCITLNMNMRDKLRALRACINLVETDFQKQINADFNKWVDRVEALNSLRNDLAHYPLITSYTDGGKHPLIRTTARGCLNVSIRGINETDIKAAIQECGECARNLEGHAIGYAKDWIDTPGLRITDIQRYDLEIRKKAARK